MNALLRGDRLQLLRLAAGLVLLAFAATHFLNHALGLVGVEAMEDFQTLRFAVTRSVIGTIVLGAALAVHLALALWKLAGRKTWRMPLWEAVQIASGLLIPALLIDHVVTTRVAATLHGAEDFYRPALTHYWPDRALRQTVLLLVVWLHACIGLHYWLRLHRVYRRVLPALVVAAVMLPVLALAGFMVAGREVARGQPTIADRQLALAVSNWPIGDARRRFDRIGWGLLVGFGGLLAGIAGIHGARHVRGRLAPRVQVTYSGLGAYEGPVGASVLEISRLNDVPHASVCGGRARCSTCRVRIDFGAEHLSPPAMAEAITLGAIKADPGVRLACQLRPTTAITVTRLVQPSADLPARIGPFNQDAAGVERELAVMFLDLRGFTALSDRRLPYDVVYLLNQFFRTIGEAITIEGGWIDKYMGDGLLAVFGRETGAQAGARSALAAARRIDLALDRLNAELAIEAGRSIDVGIGLHAGPMIVGRIGHPDTAAVTVIGRTVNTASRLENRTKDEGCQLIASRDLVELAGWKPEGAIFVPLDVRGVAQPVEVLLIARARELPERFDI